MVFHPLCVCLCEGYRRVKPSPHNYIQVGQVNHYTNPCLCHPDKSVQYPESQKSIFSDCTHSLSGWKPSQICSTVLQMFIMSFHIKSSMTTEDKILVASDVPISLIPIMAGRPGSGRYHTVININVFQCKVVFTNIIRSQNAYAVQFVKIQGTTTLLYSIY